MQIQGVVARGTDVVDGDGDLAVGLLAPRTAVLPLDPDGVGSLLGEGDIIEEEDAVGTGERVGQVSPVAAEDGLLVPGTLIHELLQGLLGVRTRQAVGQGDAAGQGLDGLALAVEEEPLEVDAGPAGGLGLGEVPGEQGRILTEAVEDGPSESWCVGLHAKLEVRTD